MMPGAGPRPMARGRGRGSTQPKVLSEEEKYGFPPGFDFKNLDESAKKLKIRETDTGGRGLISDNTIVVQSREQGVEYAKKIRLMEENKAKDNYSSSLQTEGESMDTAVGPSSHQPTDFEDVSTVMECTKADTLSLYSAFLRPTTQDVESGSPLPIEARRVEILKQIKLNSVTVIEGKTGCGKTTRVPMFIVEELCKESRQVNFNIVVTQPRRIAAVSVAQRVAQQKKVELGGLVGYQIGMDRRYVSESTRLLYCTTGVLLQRLISTKSLDGLTHIIIDEVHERNVETDLLLMVVRKLLWMKPSKVKLILMSATFESDKFMEYFKLLSVDPPLLPGKVAIDQEPRKLSGFYLDSSDLKQFSNGAIDEKKFQIDDPVLWPEVIDTAIAIIGGLRVIERNRNPGAVLVFLPGLNEIKEIEGRLKASNIGDLWILPLHSSVTDMEQQRVFERAPPEKRKVILATNIAESSITVPDISYVIDFCLTKNLVIEARTNFPMLQLEWASQANCKQRAGRAGRTQEGRFMRLIPVGFWNKLKAYPDPEIKRTPLELSILRVKKLDMGPAKDLLGLCPDPPELQDIRKSILRLKRVGGLSVVSKIENREVYDEEDGDLTAMGDIMAKLPIDVNLSKLILVGYAFGCAHDATVIAACLTIKSMFSHPHGEDLESYMSRLAWANQTYSDLFAFKTAYDMFYTFKEFLGPNAKKQEITRWCKMNYVQEKRINEVQDLVFDLKKRLNDAGLDLTTPPNKEPMNRYWPPNYTPSQEEKDRENKRVEELLLKVAVCGAFYPNYFISNPLNQDNLKKMIPAASPHSSVQISGLPPNQGVLYTHQIKNIFKIVSESIECDFEDTKAVLTFTGKSNLLEKAYDVHNYLVPAAEAIVMKETAVKRSVYIAIKMRMVRYPMIITLLKPEEAEAKMKEIEESRKKAQCSANNKASLRSGRFVVRSNPSLLGRPFLPTPNEDQLDVRVTALGGCGSFWARKLDRDLTDQIEEELFKLSVSNGLGELSGFPVVGDIVRLVHYNDQMIITHKRGRVSKIVEGSDVIDVFLVDYGENIQHKWNSSEDKVIDWINLPSYSIIKQPPQAFECQLEGIKPAVHRNPHGVWEDDAVNYFRSFFYEPGFEELKNVKFNLHVYSVLGHVTMVKDVVNYETEEHIANELVNRGFAEHTEPSDQSRREHESRSRIRENDPDILGNVSGTSIFDDDEYDVGKVDLNIARSHSTTSLKGPFSPLELDFHGANYTTHGTRITIGGDSVNSVALESEPSSAPTRILVAASVTVSDKGKVVARDTTIMPPIPGLLPLICLFFSPRVELRTDKKRQVYTGALCGLGCDPVRDALGRVVQQSRDHSNDIEVDFDTFITPMDINMINVARYLINSLLYDSGSTTINRQQLQLQGQPLYERQNNIRRAVLNVMESKRMSMTKARSHYNRGKLFHWGLIDESELETMELQNVATEASFLPIIKSVTGLSELQYLRNLCNEHEMLKLCQQTSVMTTVMDCVICGTKLNHLVQLEIHLESDEHISRYDEIRNRKEKAEELDNESRNRKMNDQ